jgi:hypothetical protein
MELEQIKMDTATIILHIDLILFSPETTKPVAHYQPI